MNIAIIGGGPAGLRAAEVAASGGASVTLFDAKPSVGRKFLVAGRGGLNLTKVEAHARFVNRYSGPDQPPEIWDSLIAEFDSEALRNWAAELGVETFAASTGRVYPRELKAAPLLRRWVERLRALKVRFAMHHRLTGIVPGRPLTLEFQVEGEMRNEHADAVVLALGGGSWPTTGSDGAWTAMLEKIGIPVAPLEPANCGWEFPWPAQVLEKAEGAPLKSIAVRAGAMEVKGELLVTKYGLEGGAIYQLGSVLRAMPHPEISIDFKPSFTVAQLLAKMGPIQRNFLAEARQRWRLNDTAFAILESRGPFLALESFVAEVKSCVLQLSAPRPIAEAISSAGGVRWRGIDGNLMLKAVPGLFVAGEMIDWEAPTGGYLIQGCFATGTRAARAALELGNKQPSY
ncbi:MAG: hypothetical protein JWL59_1910 [Chthoniobacteraceae bacterium]|nr:hypothetical protein [Chthoniobacteraceae bacterium]